MERAAPERRVPALHALTLHALPSDAFGTGSQLTVAAKEYATVLPVFFPVGAPEISQRSGDGANVRLGNRGIIDQDHPGMMLANFGHLAQQRRNGLQVMRDEGQLFAAGFGQQIRIRSVEESSAFPIPVVNGF